MSNDHPTPAQRRIIEQMGQRGQTDPLVERIKADCKAGTPGPWRIQDCESYGDRCKTFFKEVWNDDTEILVTTEVTRSHNDGGTANMRRIARVPDMEARIRADAEVIKAAEALAEAVTREREMPCQDMDMQLREIQAVDDALTAFRRAQQVRAALEEKSDD